MTEKYYARACRTVVDSEIADRVRRMYGVSLSINKDVLVDYSRGDVFDSQGRIVKRGLVWQDAVKLASESKDEDKFI